MPQVKRRAAVDSAEHFFEHLGDTLLPEHLIEHSPRTLSSDVLSRGRLGSLRFTSVRSLTSISDEVLD